ncbi:MAG: hypothetical protein JO165_14220, partial [Candidatus Eremiobacteraeota bacterium]|nr:hypothetical protein [Candidatus Eremiobacteraeota bacterium]
LHVTAALGLGGAEVNPFAFAPFGGFAEGATIDKGFASIPDLPGIGFEAKPPLYGLFRELHPKSPRSVS